jgi:Protein of unknown function (DUF2924)
VNAARVAPGGRPAPDGATSTCSPSTSTLLRTRLDRLQDLDGAALREEWRRLCRSEPPRISRDLLMRAVAYRLQELEFGGLPKWARQNLAGATPNARPSNRTEGISKPAELRLKPGARLVREWRGRTHTVMALDDGFEFEGRLYRSLTQIAREITGAHWSGPRFFGLQDRKRPPELNKATSDIAVAATEAGEANGEAENGRSEITSANARRCRGRGVSRLGSPV